MQEVRIGSRSYPSIQERFVTALTERKKITVKVVFQSQKIISPVKLYLSRGRFIYSTRNSNASAQKISSHIRFQRSDRKKTRITIYSEKKIMKGKQSQLGKLSKRQNTKVFTLETFSSRPYSCVVRSFPKFLGQDTFVARTREARHGHAFDLKTKNNPYFCEKWSKTFFGRHGLHVTAKFVIRVLKEVDIIYVN